MAPEAPAATDSGCQARLAMLPARPLNTCLKSYTVRVSIRISGFDGWGNHCFSAILRRHRRK